MENAIALLTLSSLEIVLGIDNIVFIAIVTAALPKEKQPQARRVGLAIALVQRIILLLGISWIVQLTSPLFHILEHPFSGRDLILIIGGMFLIAKATYEIHGVMETPGDDEAAVKKRAATTYGGVMIQIALLDTVFSLDSVITAVGMAKEIWVMITAVIIAVVVMMIFANQISEFILKHLTVKMLALSFLILIGVVLVADGFGKHIEKGYIYFAMGFAILVEAMNFKLRRKVKASA